MRCTRKSSTSLTEKRRGVQVGDYRVLQGLGKGASGSVFSVVDNRQSCGRTFADKVTREAPGHHREWDTMAEADLRGAIDHPNIVKEEETFFREARDTGTGQVLWEKHSILDNGGQPLSALIDGLGIAQCSEAATGDMASHIQTVRRAAAEPSGATGESAPDTSEPVSGLPRRLHKLALLERDYQHSVGDMHAIAFHPLPVAQVQSIMHQLGAALDYLHNTKQMVHCDIKPDNLLIDPANGHVTLCDFDRAISLAGAGAVVLGELAAGTLDYMPPEALEGFLGTGGRDEEIAQFPCALDSWAMGCVLYELLCAQVLFPSDGEDDRRSARSLIRKLRDQEAVHKGIAGHIDALAEQEAGGLSVEQAGHIKTLLKGLLEHDPAQRMTIRQALDNPFLNDESVVQRLSQTKIERQRAREAFGQFYG